MSNKVLKDIAQKGQKVELGELTLLSTIPKMQAGGGEILKGIDLLYENSTPPPSLLVVEAKYNTAKLSKLADGTKQMSDKWIQERLAYNMKGLSYSRIISQVNPDGSGVFNAVDEFGNIIEVGEGFNKFETELKPWTIGDVVFK